MYHGRLTQQHQSGNTDMNLTPTREIAERHTVIP
jgi:hypothetical protein